MNGLGEGRRPRQTRSGLLRDNGVIPRNPLVLGLSISAALNVPIEKTRFGVFRT